MTDTSSELSISDIELLALLDEAVGENQSTMLSEYLELVANKSLSILKTDRYLQYGGKLGQSLYAHILDGIFLLDQLCKVFALAEQEARVLFTAYTIHDINKLLDTSAGLARDAVPEKIDDQIRKFDLDHFFPQYSEYLYDITTLARMHPGHTSVAGESFNRGNATRYGLGLDRVEEIASLMRALDVIDLSHTLEEQAHKATFLSNINQFALNIGVQYAFFVHQLDESRGALTNIFHNAISDYLHEHAGLMPLLLYPNGIVYLHERGREPHISDSDIDRIATRAAGEVARMTGESFENFIDGSRPMGIKVDPKCLELGRPFDDILKTIDGIVQRRSFKQDELVQKVRDRTKASFAKYAALYPESVLQVQELLSDNPIAHSDERLRLGELIRSYYIFLMSHFRKVVPDAWQRIYELLDLPTEQQHRLAFFDARMDRAYVLARDLALDTDTVYTKILEDGRELLSARTSDDPRATLFAAYVVRHARFGTQPHPITFGESLHQYVTRQHKQCVQCSDPFPTTPWMSADVRSDIAVQTFSNRLRGGPGEPKKQVCGICQAQFLVERLSYLEIRGEHTIYLNLFPYSYLTRSFVLGMRRVMQKLQAGDLRALWLDGDRAMQRYINDQRITAPMLTHTRQGKSHVYGVYLPSHADALIGNLLILPINPAGDTDTERFLFGLEYALILQRYFSCRVVLSASPVVPFDQESLGDLNTDMTPLSCRGLIDQDVYRQFEEKSAKPGQLPVLWQQLSDLYTIKRRVSTGQDDPLPELVEALAFHPLGIFYTTEKLIEQRVRDDRKTRSPELLLIDISRHLLPAVARLAKSKGGIRMEQLSAHMQRLSQVAWKHRLVGRTWAKNSLMAALDEVFRKIAQRSKAVENDTDALKAATVEDIFAYLERIAEPKYPAGQRKWEASKEFVDLFYSGIYNGIYGGSTARLLSDEKLLRSIYMFYMREQAPRKVVDAAEKGEIENLAAVAEE